MSFIWMVMFSLTFPENIVTDNLYEIRVAWVYFQSVILLWGQSFETYRWHFSMVKIDRGFIGLGNDLYVANVYVVPETSVYSCHDMP